MKPSHYFRVQPRLPKELKQLESLAQNLYHRPYLETEDLFKTLNPEGWGKCGHNPLLFLRSLSPEVLKRAAGDGEYLRRLEEVWIQNRKYWDGPSGWIAGNQLSGDSVIAFFSAEFGVASHLPNYAGGLGVLAGDYLKSAGDLGLPLVGVGLLYRQGYFKQYIDQQGWQRELYPNYDFQDFALEPVNDVNGTPVAVSVDFPDRTVAIRAWRCKVGRIPLYLLDTDHGGNWADDRRITDRLYGGDSEKRMQQEIVLGIGGIRMLEALGVHAAVCHLNEGHSAFLALERIRRAMNVFRIDFAAAKELAASGNVFTTHTPVAAGIDVFQPGLMDKYFTAYYQAIGLPRNDFMALGRMDPPNQHEAFNMAVLALRLSDWANGVSRLHGFTARRMWQQCWPGLNVEDIPIQSVTNGVHAVTWVGPHMSRLYNDYLGPKWAEDPSQPDSWSGIQKTPDEALWEAHEAARADLIDLTRKRYADRMKNWGIRLSGQECAAEILNPRALTIGFARRFAAYKRPTLLFRFADRLIRLLHNEKRPVQIVYSGKAHPSDDEGKRLIQQIIGLTRNEDYRRHVAFLEDYDMDTAKALVQGVDVWLGNPRRPLEASSTSGMKAVLNGALHIHTLDGWWDEAWNPEAGWAIGTGEGEECDNPDYLDRIEAESLFDLLENEIIPLFYTRDDQGLPKGWIAKMKRSVQTYGPLYNTHRMVEEYSRQFYIPALTLHNRLDANGQQAAKDLAVWKQRLGVAWPGIGIEKVKDDADQPVLSDGRLSLRVWVCLGELHPKDVTVETLYGPVDCDGELRPDYRMVLNLCGQQGDGKYLYQGEMDCRAGGQYGYTIRVLPSHPDLAHPYIPGFIHWEEK